MRCGLVERSVLQMLIGGLVVFVILYVISFLCHYVRLLWRWYRLKKAGADLQKCIGDFFSNLPPRESEHCRDCKHSDISKNNGNLLCLHEKSRHFGEAVAPAQDMMGYCYFERENASNPDNNGGVQ